MLYSQFSLVIYFICSIGSVGFPGGSTVRNPPVMQMTWLRSLGWDDPLEKEMATDSSILPRKSHGPRSLVG